jgi:hypothetical protein
MVRQSEVVLVSFVWINSCRKETREGFHVEKNAGIHSIVVK